LPTLRCYAGPDDLTASTIRLSEAESRHAQASRRLRAGDEVTLFDGRGSEGIGHIKVIERHAVFVRVEAVKRREFDAPSAVTLAVAMPKGPRQDVLVEKCTELGAKAFWPITCERSIARPSEHRLVKLRRTAIEACKQSQRAWLPEIGSPATFSQVLQQNTNFAACIMAHLDGQPLSCGAVAGHDVLVLIGPEGGFTDEEVAAARAARFSTIRLGPTHLRTETAAIAATAQLLMAPS